jgi:hypothetical protein
MTMRILNVQLDSIYIYTMDDSEESKAKRDREKLARAEKRRATLAKVGLIVDETDLTRAIPVAVTETQLADLMAMGESVHVSSSFDVAADPLLRASSVITEAAAKVAKFADSLPDVNNHYNERVEVYTPGAGLMLFNRVMLLQDGCSDALQSELDNGWRIVAACPQPDQRRPDYILGRYDPAHAEEAGRGSSALRSYK